MTGFTLTAAVFANCLEFQVQSVVCSLDPAIFCCLICLLRDASCLVCMVLPRVHGLACNQAGLLFSSVKLGTPHFCAYASQHTVASVHQLTSFCVAASHNAIPGWRDQGNLQQFCHHCRASTCCL